VGWVLSYALVDRTGERDLAELRSLQDWFLKLESQTVLGVAEVATVGGMVRQYQVVVDPEKLRAYGIPLARLTEAIRAANREVGGSVLELAEAEYMVRTRGYIQSLEDIETIPIEVSATGTPILLRELARVQIGPEMRRVVADLDGKGEITGGIVVMRYGENALATIAAVKEKFAALEARLPAAVELVTMGVRPKAMTVATIIAGLLPTMPGAGAGAGSEVIRRIAAPMVGGMVTAPLLSLFVIPAIYLIWRLRNLDRRDAT